MASRRCPKERHIAKPNRKKKGTDEPGKALVNLRNTTKRTITTSVFDFTSEEDEGTCALSTKTATRNSEKKKLGSAGDDTVLPISMGKKKKKLRITPSLSELPVDLPRRLCKDQISAKRASTRAPGLVQRVTVAPEDTANTDHLEKIYPFLKDTVLPEVATAPVNSKAAPTSRSTRGIGSVRQNNGSITKLAAPQVDAARKFVPDVSTVQTNSKASPTSLSTHGTGSVRSNHGSITTFAAALVDTNRHPPEQLTPTTFVPPAHAMDGTTDEESAEEDKRISAAEIFDDPVYNDRPRYDFARFWRGSATVPKSTVLEGCEFTQSMLRSSIFSDSWLPVEEPRDKDALDTLGVNTLEDLIRSVPVSLVVDKLSIFGLSCVEDIAVAMSILRNTTVCNYGTYLLDTFNYCLCDLSLLNVSLDARCVSA